MSDSNGGPVAQRCPKCGYTSGDDWRQCKGSCPMLGSPHYAAPAPTVNQLLVRARNLLSQPSHWHEQDEQSLRVRIALSDEIHAYLTSTTP